MQCRVRMGRQGLRAGKLCSLVVNKMQVAGAVAAPSAPSRPTICPSTSCALPLTPTWPRAPLPALSPGVIAGFVALDERLPTHHGLKVIRLCSWMCILLGVTSLAGGMEAVAALARAITYTLRLPKWAWRYLPRSLAQAMHRWEKQLSVDDDEGLMLPVANAPGAQGQGGSSGGGGGSGGGGEHGGGSAA